MTSSLQTSELQAFEETSHLGLCQMQRHTALIKTVWQGSPCLSKWEKHVVKHSQCLLHRIPQALYHGCSWKLKEKKGSTAFPKLISQQDYFLSPFPEKYTNIYTAAQQDGEVHQQSLYPTHALIRRWGYLQRHKPTLPFHFYLRVTRMNLITCWWSSLQHPCCTVSKSFRANCCLEGPSSSVDMQSSKAVEERICRAGMTSSEDDFGIFWPSAKERSFKAIHQNNNSCFYKLMPQGKQNAILFKGELQELSLQLGHTYN